MTINNRKKPSKYINCCTQIINWKAITAMPNFICSAWAAEEEEREMHKIIWSFFLLLCFVLASCSDQKPAPIQTVTGKSPSGGSGYLELAGPEFVNQNLQFTMNVKFSTDPKYKGTDISIQAEGCEVIATCTSVPYASCILQTRPLCAQTEGLTDNCYAGIRRSGSIAYGCLQSAAGIARSISSYESPAGLRHASRCIAYVR